MKTYVQFIIRFRWAISLALCLGLLLALFGVSRLEVGSDWERLIPYPEEAELVRVISRVNSSQGLMFLFSSTGDRPVLEQVDDIEPIVELMRDSDLFHRVLFSFDSQELKLDPAMLLAFLPPEELPVVIERMTPAGAQAMVDDNARLLFTPAGDMAKQLLREDPLHISRLAGAHAQFRSGYTFEDGHMISENGQRLLVMGIPRDGQTPGGLLDLNRLMVAVRARSADAQLECLMPGGAFLRAELLDTIRKDMVGTVTFSFVTIVLLFMWVYRRSLRAVWCVVLPLIFSLAATFGLYAAVCRSIDIITAMSAAMLVGLGVDFGIHLMGRYRIEHGTTEERLIATLRGTGRGIISGALTTALAFLSIIVTRMRSFYPLGITSALGIIAALVSCFVILPLLVAFLKPYPRPEDPVVFGPDFLTKHARKLVVCSLLALLIAAPFGLSRLSFQADFRMFVPDDSRALRDLRTMAGYEDWDDEPDTLIVVANARGYERDSALAEKLAERFPGADWQSPFTMIPTSTRLDEQRTAFREACRESEISIATGQSALAAAFANRGLKFGDQQRQYVASVFDAFQPGHWETLLYKLPIVDRFFGPDRKEVVLLGLRRNGKWQQTELDAANAMLEAEKAGGRATAGSTILERIRKRCIPESILSGCAAAACVFVILRVHFRRGRRILAVFSPLIVGLFGTCVAMGFLGMSFNFFNMTMIPLIFGIGIDDGIHFMQAVRETGSTRQAMRTTLRPIFLTTLTTCLGVGSLMTVSFKGIASMGLTVVIGLTACLITTAVVLPALAMRVEREATE